VSLSSNVVDFPEMLCMFRQTSIYLPEHMCCSSFVLLLS
jgi:hypothetical protein